MVAFDFFTTGRATTIPKAGGAAAQGSLSNGKEAGAVKARRGLPAVGGLGHGRLRPPLFSPICVTPFLIDCSWVSSHSPLKAWVLRWSFPKRRPVFLRFCPWRFQMASAHTSALSPTSQKRSAHVYTSPHLSRRTLIADCPKKRFVS